MKLWIAGQEQTDERGKTVQAAAQQRQAAGLTRLIEDEQAVLTLATADTETAYLDCHIRVLRDRNRIDPSAFSVPPSPGPLGRALRPLRRLLWKGLRYQHEWFAAQQNAINVQLAYELEFERNLHRKQVAALEQRLTRLEHSRDPSPTPPAPLSIETSADSRPAPPSFDGPLPPCVDQLLAGFAGGDAISQEAVCIRNVLRGLGVRSDIYAPRDRCAEDTEDECLDMAARNDSAETMLIYHYSIASPATAVFRAATGRKVLRYHNITPAEFFDGYDDDIAAQLRAGRTELEDVARTAGTVWADSAFNAAEIAIPGVETRVVPLAFDANRFQCGADAGTLARLSPPPKNVLFVGRIAPNKCIEDLILAFAWLNRSIDPFTRLVLVGSERSCPRYFAMLHLLARRLRLPNVAFMGFLNQAQLAACYQAADLFVCASRHEGYCLPLVEAMAAGVPVIARHTGGMPETLGNAGVLYDDTDARSLAELMGRVMADTDLNRGILAAQTTRMEEMGQRNLEEEYRRLLTGAVNEV